MQCNIGKNDKNIRLALGVLIVLWGLFYKNWWGLIGLLLLITAFVSWCPLYAVLGIKTCKHDEEKNKEEAAPADSGASQMSESEMGAAAEGHSEETTENSEADNQLEGGDEEQEKVE